MHKFWIQIFILKYRGTFYVKESDSNENNNNKNSYNNDNNNSNQI